MISRSPGPWSAILFALALAGAAPATATRWARIETALSSIPTVTGQSALERIGSCSIRIDRRRSRIDAVAGGYDMAVRVQLLNEDGDDFHLVHLAWTVRGGRATPASGWAQKLQDQPSPLGLRRWMRC